MANENQNKPQSEGAGSKAAPDLAAQLAAAQAALAQAQALLVEKDERIADLKDMVEHLKGAGGGASVLHNAEDLAHQKRVAEAKQELEDKRAEAMEIAGPKAQMVKYIVGPSGTVRDGLGVVAPGKVIDVPISELPSREWKVWKPGTPDAPKPDPLDTARAIQRRDGPTAAEKAIAQREELKRQREA